MFLYRSNIFFSFTKSFCKNKSKNPRYEIITVIIKLRGASKCCFAIKTMSNKIIGTVLRRYLIFFEFAKATKEQIVKYQKENICQSGATEKAVPFL